MNSGQKIGGFTLVEVLLVTFIIVVATIPIMNAFFQGTRWTAESREMIMALNLAQMVLEKLYDKEYDELDASEVKSRFPLTNIHNINTKYWWKVMG